MRLAALFVLGAAALLPCAPARADDALTQAQKAAIDRQIHDYIAAHPQELLDALKTAQQQSDAQAAEQSRRVIAQKQKELFDDKDDLVQGNPKADVTIVEFFDYRCPYCKEIEPSLDALLQDDGKLRIVYKEFPILGEASVFAAHVALAAKQQGRYAQFHRAMMATKGDITDDVVLKVAASVGLDTGKIKADMGASAIGTVIDTNYDLAEAIGVEGTPGLIVGGALIPGAVDIDTLRKDIAAARQHS